jgi:altronate dehydratase
VIVFGSPQEHGGVSATYEAVRAAAERHAADLARQPRERVALKELTIGLESGGSDAWSGVTANPALGRAADRLVEAGQPSRRSGPRAPRLKRRQLWRQPGVEPPR